MHQGGDSGLLGLTKHPPRIPNQSHFCPPRPSGNPSPSSQMTSKHWSNLPQARPLSLLDSVPDEAFVCCLTYRSHYSRCHHFTCVGLQVAPPNIFRGTRKKSKDLMCLLSCDSRNKTTSLRYSHLLSNDNGDHIVS